MATSLTDRLLALRQVPLELVGITALASFSGPILAGFLAWPLWAMLVLAVLPWLPLFTGEIAWTARHYQWLALFAVLVITQTGHLFEHVAQMVQIHILGLPAAQAHGIIGALDVEWVHFLWNGWVLVGVVLLLDRYRANRWLWATLVITAWHTFEHIVILGAYLMTGKAGAPGLLAQGGLIGGGLPITRPDLHFLYNLVETLPLWIAFVYQARRTVNVWMAHAFPQMPRPQLVAASDALRPVQFRAGALLAVQGEPATDLFIITAGQATATSLAGAAVPLTPGQVFGADEAAAAQPYMRTLRATADGEALALPAAVYRRALADPPATDTAAPGLVSRPLTVSPVAD
jgi:hypothetical protein